MRQAPVPAFAVHDHAARQHEPPPEALLVQRGQQDGGAGVVVADIRGRVGEVDTQTDHGGLVADGVDARDRHAHGVGVTNVGSVNIDAFGGPRSGRGGVEHADFVPAVRRVRRRRATR